MQFFDPADQNPELVRSERKQLGTVALAVTAIFLLSLIVQRLFYLLLGNIFSDLVQRLEFRLLFSSFCMYAIAMPLSLILFGRAKKNPPEQRQISVVTFLALLSVSLILVFFGSLVGNFFNTLIEILTGKPAVNPVQEMTEGMPIWLNTLLMAILAPILEEVFFRRMVIDRLRRYGDGKAILFSGILFGLIHGNFSQFFYAAMLGILFGFIYCQTGRIRYTVALHMIINLLGGVYATEMLRKLEPLTAGGSPFDAIGGLIMFGNYLLIYGAALVGLPFALVLLRKKIHLEPGIVWMSKTSWSRAALLNPAIWVLVAMLGFLWLF